LAHAAPGRPGAGASASTTAPGRSGNGGAALAAPLRQRMEGLFGADFSTVRVHQSGNAEALDAVAYAHGENLHFKPGAYDPESEAGRELIGHELAHVMQQRAGRVAAPQGKGSPIVADAVLEAEADAMGGRVARGESVAGAFSGGGGGSLAAVQCMKITGFEDGKELVLFEDGDERPDMNGRYHDDGYRYVFRKDLGEGQALYARERPRAQEKNYALLEAFDDLEYTLSLEDPQQRDEQSEQCIKRNQKFEGRLRQRKDEILLEKTEEYGQLKLFLEKAPAANVTEVRLYAKEIAAPEPVVEHFLGRHFTHAIRFSSPQDMKPKGVPPTPWHGLDKFPKDVLSRAGGHMSGNNKEDKSQGDSPFVSLALSEGALLQHGDAWVSGIMYGNSEGHAPFISSLRVPNRSFIGPEMVKDHLQGLDKRRSENETEVLYYGEGLSHYVTETRKNPYNQDDRQVLQGLDKMKEEEDDSSEDIPVIVEKEKTLNIRKLIGQNQWPSCRKILLESLEIPELSEAHAKIKECLENIQKDKPGVLSVNGATRKLDDAFKLITESQPAAWELRLLWLEITDVFRE
jgi:Domain of unknown function (DUF4157)